LGLQALLLVFQWSTLQWEGRGDSKELKDKGEGAWGSCMLVEVIEARLAVITAYQLRKELINCASFHLF